MEYTLREQDIVKANIEIGLGSLKTRLILGLIFTLLISSGVILQNRFSGELIFAGVGGLIGYLLVAFVVIPYRSRTAYRSYRIIQLPVKLLISDSGISFLRENGEFTILWSQIYAWKNLKNSFAVMPSKNIYHLIPKEQIGSENTEEISKMLLKNVGNAT